MSSDWLLDSSGCELAASPLLPVLIYGPGGAAVQPAPRTGVSGAAAASGPNLSLNPCAGVSALVSILVDEAPHTTDSNTHTFIEPGSFTSSGCDFLKAACPFHDVGDKEES